MTTLNGTAIADGRFCFHHIQVDDPFNAGVSGEFGKGVSEPVVLTVVVNAIRTNFDGADLCQDDRFPRCHLSETLEVGFINLIKRIPHVTGSVIGAGAEIHGAESNRVDN